MSLKVLDPGPLTTVQDAGRTGYAAQGYRACGAADSYAYRLGNMLIGNAPGAAVLECTLRGAALQFETDTVFALTGAVSPAELDGVPVPYYAPLFAKAGSTLQMGMASTGLRSYLAVGGGIATLPVLGSRATDLKCCIGGLDGRKLAKGDTLPTGRCDTAALWRKIITCHLDRPLQDTCITTALHPVRILGTQTFPLLRAVPGPQDAAFTSAGLHIFTHGVYQLTPNCDRMACKLAGPAIEMKHGRGHPVRRHRGRLGTNFCRQPTHCDADRPPDHRRLRQDCHRHLGRSARTGPAAPGADGGLYFCLPRPGCPGLPGRQAAILQQIAARLL